MKRRSDLLLQHRPPSSAMYSEKEMFGAPRKRDSLGMVKLCVQRLENFPYNLLYDNNPKKATYFYEAKLGKFIGRYKWSDISRSGDRFYRLYAFSARPAAIACSISACASSSLTAGTFFHILSNGEIVFCTDGYLMPDIKFRHLCEVVPSCFLW